MQHNIISSIFSSHETSEDSGSLENIPLIERGAVASSEEVVQVVANVQIQKRDSVGSNFEDGSNMSNLKEGQLGDSKRDITSPTRTKTECYVGHVTHLTSKAVSWSYNSYYCQFLNF